VRSVIVTSLLLFFSMLFLACGGDENRFPLVPSQPYPAEGATVPVDVNFTWVCTDPDGDPLVYDLYLNDDLVAPGLTHPSYTTKLKPGTAYAWHVVTKDNAKGVTKGPIWKFTTKGFPLVPSQPYPSQGATVPVDVNFTWVCTDPDGDPLVYDLYLNGDLVAQGLTKPSYTTKLKQDTAYTWQVVAKDNAGGVTKGPVWMFTTEAANKPPVAPYQPQPKENETVSANMRLTWNCSDPDGDPLLYDIYINGSLVASSVSNQFYEAKLKNGLTYEWFIVAKDNKGNKTDGPRWVFNTDPLLYINAPAGAVKVEASSYVSWEMILSKGDKLHVAITSNNTIDVWLLSKLEFDHFVKNENFNFIREGSSKQIINFNFDFVVPESGGYRLVLDNRAAWFFSKNVSVFVYWSHYN